MDLSPKFIKPFDVFMRGRKRQRQLDDDYSPLKCLSGNNSSSDPVLLTDSPIRIPVNANTSRSPSIAKVRRRISLTPVKTGSPSHANIVSRSENQENESAFQSPPTMRHAIKRQLNFGGIFSPSTAAGQTAGTGQAADTGTPAAGLQPNASPSVTVSSDPKSHSGRKDKKKRRSASEDLSKQKTITDMFKPMTPSTTEKTEKTDNKKKPSESPVSSISSTSSTATSITAAVLPIDWSLKTRVRITCKNFPKQLFRGSFKLSEDASGVTSFVRCMHHTMEEIPLSSTQPSTTESGATSLTSQSITSSVPQMDTSAPAILRQHTMVWSFPSIPFLQPLFPRIGAQVNTSTGSTSMGPMSQPAIECMEREFSLSLKSLVAQCKARQCPYFYVCASQFTVLFRAAGVGGAKDAIHALVSPTTTGLRKQLTEYGIGFMSPFDQQASDLKSSKSASSFSEDSTSKRKEEIVVLDDEDPDTILTELGLSQQDFPSLQSQANKQAAKGKGTGFGATDTSLIMICGTDVQSFVNLLYESVNKIATAKTGRLAGVPPTIVSPVAFAGATLTPFKIKHQRTKGNGTSASGFTETFDIMGPILPNNVSALVNHFRSLSHESTTGVTTTVNLITEENTSPFTNVTVVTLPPVCVDSTATSATTASSFGGEVFLQQSLSDCCLQKELIVDMCSPVSQARKPVKEVSFCPQQKYLSYS